jgi:phosphate starvation-inducible PhoH-like protein
VLPDTGVLSLVCGTNDSNLRLIERHLGVPVWTRGNELSISGDDPTLHGRFRQILDRVIAEAHTGAVPDADLLESIFNVPVGSDSWPAKADPPPVGAPGPEKTAPRGPHAPPVDENNGIAIPGGTKRVYPKTPHQAAFVRALYERDLVFCTGPAGTGKTYLAIAVALQYVLGHKKETLIMTRPVVEAGESLGYLPGDLEQKINPYLRPLHDAIAALLGREAMRRLLDSGAVEIAPLAYMRGRTLQNSIVLLDEAQNTSREQMKMFLTRSGEGSKVIVTGDITQIDLPKRTPSGLVQALSILQNINEIAHIRMDFSDCVRSPLVKKIVEAYENAQKSP